MICPVLELLQTEGVEMRRTERLQGLRLMKFEEVYGKSRGGTLSLAEAAEVLGMSERTFRRWFRPGRAPMSGRELIASL